jgi:hypothetical protein
MSLLSDEKATEQIVHKWPLSGCCSVPVVISQSRIVLSLDLDTTSLSSSEKATELTELEWLFSVYCNASVVVS